MSTNSPFPTPPPSQAAPAAPVATLPASPATESGATSYVPLVRGVIRQGDMRKFPGSDELSAVGASIGRTVEDVTKEQPTARFFRVNRAGAVGSGASAETGVPRAGSASLAEASAGKGGADEGVGAPRAGEGVVKGTEGTEGTKGTRQSRASAETGVPRAAAGSEA